MSYRHIASVLLLALSMAVDAANVILINPPANPRGHSAAITSVTKPNEMGQVGVQVYWYQSFRCGKVNTCYMYQQWKAARFTPGVGLEILSDADSIKDTVVGIAADGSVYGANTNICATCITPMSGRIWTAPGVYVDKPSIVRSMNSLGDYVSAGRAYDRKDVLLPNPPGNIALINDSREVVGEQVFEPMSNYGTEQAANADGTGWFLPKPLPKGQIGWPAPVSILGSERYVMDFRNNGKLAIAATAHPYYTTLWSGVTSRVCDYGHGYDSRGTLINVPVNYVCAEYPDFYIAGINDQGDAVGGLFSSGSWSRVNLFQAAWIGGVKKLGTDLLPGWTSVQFIGINNAGQISGIGKLAGLSYGYIVTH